MDRNWCDAHNHCRDLVKGTSVVQFKWVQDCLWEKNSCIAQVLHFCFDIGNKLWWTGDRSRVYSASRPSGSWDRPLPSNNYRVHFSKKKNWDSAALPVFCPVICMIKNNKWKILHLLSELLFYTMTWNTIIAVVKPYWSFWPEITSNGIFFHFFESAIVYIYGTQHCIQVSFLSVMWHCYVVCCVEMNTQEYYKLIL